MFDTLVGLIEFLMGCLTLLFMTFLIVMALPKSPMQQFAVKVCGWAVALVCGLYVVIPDPLPVVIDDIGALLLGIGGAIAAKRAGKNMQEVSKPVVDALTARHAHGPRSRIQQKP